ncbi:MAG: DinB family protein [Acidobacteriaceae bacterium]
MGDDARAVVVGGGLAGGEKDARIGDGGDRNKFRSFRRLADLESRTARQLSSGRLLGDEDLGVDMNELEPALVGESAHAAPAHILEGLGADVVHREIAGAPHTIYQELWHIVFWLQMSLDWIAGVATAYPVRSSDAFPGKAETEGESWNELCLRFFRGIEEAAAIARDENRLDLPVQCSSRPGEPLRTMTVREQLESLAAHNAYHFGRIVLLRQMCGAWPPKSGGLNW